MSALSDRLATLAPAHQAALLWFNNQRGNQMGWPASPLNEETFLVNRHTGIQKPKGWPYALSIRETLKSDYGDEAPSVQPDGSWTYSYFQERKDPEQAGQMATNKGLVACMRDSVPVAVIIQEQAKPALYRVMGLARVIEFREGYFRLQGYSDAGELPAASLAAEKPYDLPSASFASVAEPPLPIDPADARRRIQAQIFVRQGGGAFRDEALKRFAGRCAISAWDVREVLEAAHIVPYLGEHTNTPDNALLLRADLHTLFDRDLLTIDPDTLRVRLSDELANGPYSVFGGKEIARPAGVTRETLRSRLLERSEAMAAKAT